jgi:hypothetical protein
MDHFIDGLSKRLAPAVSRRNMLSVTARTLFGAFVAHTGIDKALGKEHYDLDRVFSESCSRD